MIYDQNFIQGSDINIYTNVLFVFYDFFCSITVCRLKLILKKLENIIFYVQKTFVSFAMVSECVDNVYLVLVLYQNFKFWYYDLTADFHPCYFLRPP